MKRLCDVASHERVFTEGDIESLAKSIYESVKPMIAADQTALLEDKTVKRLGMSPNKYREIGKTIGGQIKTYILHTYGDRLDQHYKQISELEARIVKLEGK